MPTKQVEARVIIGRRPDIGHDITGDVDVTALLSGVGGTLLDVFELSPAAVDEAHALPASPMVAIVSRDNAFTLSLRSGEVVLAGLQFIVIAGDDGGEAAVPAGSIVLTGNGVSVANIEIWAVRVGS